MAISVVNVAGYGPCTIEHHPIPIYIRRIECWCGAKLGKGDGWFCHRCTEKLTFELAHNLNWNQGDDDSYQEAAAYLATLAGHGDDTRSAAQRAEDEASETYDDVITGLPAALQELLTGHVIEKTIEAPETDSVYAHVFAGLPAELQKAILGE
ncbi:MAG TPA: hypothetical protein VN476_05050 [Pyrinomonadaceae bacterium]|nr:hypothetical protein [Pyrinomonadaceae bacterium]